MKHMRPNDRNYFWVRPVSNFRYLWKPLAMRIAKATGLTPIFIVDTAQDKAFYVNDGEYKLEDDQIHISPLLYAEAIANSQKSLDEVLLEVAKLEQKYQVSFLRDLIQADRHFGKDMAWGWNGLPNSIAAEKSSYTGALFACLRSFEFHEDLFKRYEPAIIIGFGLGSGIATKPLPLLCRKNNIFFRSLSSSRLDDYFYWAEDEFNNNLALEAEIKTQEAKIKKQKNSTALSATPSSIYSYFQKKEGRPQSLASAVFDATYQLASGYYHRYKGYANSKTGYYPWSKAASQLYRWWCYRQSERHPFLSLEDLPIQQKIVLFPLQFEFEASLYGETPEANSLLFSIYETATSLPAGVILAVKEHPLQPGRRPSSFYDMILKIPNVMLLKPSVPLTELLPVISAVVQLNSSLGYEAAVSGQLVFCFSRHGVIRASSNFRKIQRFEDLLELRQFLLSTSDDDFIQARIDAGKAFKQAVKEFCFVPPSIKSMKEGMDDSADFTQMIEHLLNSCSGIKR